MQSTEKPINPNTLQDLFEKSADVRFQTYTFDKQQVLFITCDAMIDEQLLNDTVLQRVQSFVSSLGEESFEDAVVSRLHIPAFQQVNNTEDIIASVYTGHVLLYFEQFDMLFKSNIAKKPNRSPEETKLEVAVKGPKDNFIEDIAVNIALIRKRVPTNSLCVEKFELGKRSKTTVAMLYFNDITDSKLIADVRKHLESVDSDVVISGDLLMERVNKNTKLVPKTDDTGRADFAVQSLVRGRMLILVDGVAYCMITPVNLFMLLKSGEDNESPNAFSSFSRLLRLSGLLIGLLTPAFWLALTTFHQNQLPFQLLATVVVGNTGLPLPSALETILMVLMFELFREAGLRLPSAVGGTISVVGGLIIGDAAIRAGITSAAMVVVIATSTIASFTLVNQSLVNSVSIMRLFFIVLSAFLGLFGFFMAVYFTVIYLANIRIFGVPYLNITADLSWSNLTKSIIRLSPKGYEKRPEMLDPVDQTRTKGENNG